MYQPSKAGAENYQKCAETFCLADFYSIHYSDAASELLLVASQKVVRTGILMIGHGSRTQCTLLLLSLVYFLQPITMSQNAITKTRFIGNGSGGFLRHPVASVWVVRYCNDRNSH